MAEVFKQTLVNLGGAFAPKGGVLTFSGNTRPGLTPVLAQNLALDFSQQVSRLYELSDGVTIPSVYDIGGRAEGMLAVGRILGPRMLMEQFLTTYGDICQAGGNNVRLAIATQCDVDNQPVFDAQFNLRYCILQRMGVRIDAQMMLTQHQSQLRFAVLECLDPEAPSPPPARTGGTDSKAGNISSTGGASFAGLP